MKGESLASCKKMEGGGVARGGYLKYFQNRGRLAGADLVGRIEKLMSEIDIGKKKRWSRHADEGENKDF